MSKFVRLISTFKNGLVSPRLRGAITEPTDFSSAEILENFIIDRSGAPVKRAGFPLINKISKGANSKIVAIDFLGKEYLFHLDLTKSFNAVDGSNNSTFLTIIRTDGDLYNIKVFSAGTVTNATTVDPLAMWNGRHATNGVYISSGLKEYLNKTFNFIYRVEKISDRTAVVTTDKFSFLISLLDYTSGNTAVREFIVYPYFVSANLLLATLGKTVADAVKCPIVPSNFPFNSVNTDTTLLYSTGAWVVSGNAQTGSLPSNGIITKSNERMCWSVDVPKSLTIIASFEGRFLSIPTADATKDVVFFITNQIASTSTTVTYNAIQVVGGTPASSGTVASQWKVSTWGAEHPVSVGFCFGRLLYGNIASSPSQWWASAIHPDFIQYFQGFMTSNLVQDASSNVSGINYNGVALSSLDNPYSSTGRTFIRDIYRFGFNGFVPNFGAIKWITSRRRIHFGTDNGESQLTTDNGAYLAAGYSQNITGTNKSILGIMTSGNRRIFYAAAQDPHTSYGGSEIRSISTEDKDYESVDQLVSTALEGLHLNIQKLEWSEELGGVLVLCANTSTGVNDLYFLTYNSDSQIKAFSKIITVKNIVDISRNYILLQDDTTSYFTKLSISDLASTITGAGYGDIYIILTSKTDIAAGMMSPYYGKDVKLQHRGIEYSFTVPSSVFDPYELPIDPDDISLGNGGELYVYLDSYKARLKSFPIHEGAKFGSSVGDVQRVDRISVLIDNSGPFYYGSEENNLIKSESVGIKDTKIVTIDFPQSPDREQFIYIESSDPTPLNISGISLRGVSYSGE